MFENLNWWEIGALLMLALLIFGERLPKVIGEGLRMLRGLRAMAQNATSDLSRELGTDIQLQDLHPKAFIRKHLLSEDEEQALRKPFQGLYEEVKTDLSGIKTDLDDAAKAADLKSRRDPVSSSGASVNGSSATGSSASGSSATGSSANGAGPPAGSTSARAFDADAT